MHTDQVAEGDWRRRATAALACEADPIVMSLASIQSSARQSSLPPSLIEVGPFAGLHNYRQVTDRYQNVTSAARLDRRVQVLEPDPEHPDSGYAPAKPEALPQPCGDSVFPPPSRGDPADVCFIQLESEPTPHSLDRRRTGHYRRRGGVGSARGKRPSSLSPGWPNIRSRSSQSRRSTVQLIMPDCD
jgi:hypothetical protein